MHELSLAENLRELIEEQAASEGFDKVEIVKLEVGQLSHVDADAMLFCFDTVMKGSIAEGARLVISRPVGLGECRNCQAQSKITYLYAPCSHCGAFGLRILQGDQLRISSLKVRTIRTPKD